MRGSLMIQRIMMECSHYQTGKQTDRYVFRETSEARDSGNERKVVDGI